MTITPFLSPFGATVLGEPTTRNRQLRCGRAQQDQECCDTPRDVAAGHPATAPHRFPALESSPRGEERTHIFFIHTYTSALQSSVYSIIVDDTWANVILTMH